MAKISWGILATGNVAGNMAHALQNLSSADLIAVASRTQQKAEAFGERWNIPKRYGSYEELVDNPEIDIIYVASPHNRHYENVLMCLRAGKHVLCEKAFTLNAQQANECIQVAREQNLFLMEAMWMRFFPAMVQVREWLAEKRIGDIRLVQADFCLSIPFDPEHRLYNLTLGGGALLDLGVYPISFISMVLGLERVQHIHSHAHLGTSGVDELDTVILTYENDTSAMFSCGLRAYKPREAFIIGTEGYIKVQNIFFRPDYVTLHLNGQNDETFYIPFTDNGYVHEIQEVHDCLRNSQRESQTMLLAETLEIVSLMDQLRREWGVTYPEERN